MRWIGGSRIRWVEACLSAGTKTVHSLLADMALIRREEIMEVEERMAEYLWWREWRRKNGLPDDFPEFEDRPAWGEGL